MKSWLILFVLFVLVSTLGYTQVTNKLDNLQVGTLTTKTIDVTSTVKASKPCPKMTLAERDAIVAPLEGQCIYNSTAKTLNLYDGAAWVEVAGGGEGGIANWQTATFYDVDDVVIYSGNIYQCITQHTSGGSFDPSKFNILAQDLASATGVLDLSKGGTNKSLTALTGGVIYTDSDSLEVLDPGNSGQFLKSNGLSQPTWGDISVDDSSFSGVLSLSKGGTNKNITAQDKAIVYSDSDSLELLAPGTAGQVLKMGTTAPEWGNAGVSVSNNYATATELSKLTVPNEVLTEQAAGEYYLEKNNNNILRDPSFEGGSYASIWSVNVSSDQFGTGAIDGGYTLRALPSSQTVEILQDSSLYIDAFADGSVQGMASARIKTSVTGVKLCPRKATVTQTSLCVTHTGSGKWEHLKVPFILGDTSNGLVILTDTAKTGTIYVDDAFVGAVDLSANTPSTTVQSTAFSGGAINAGTQVTSSAPTTGSGLYTYSSGNITAIENDVKFDITLTLTATAGATVEPEIRINGTTVSSDNSPGVTGQTSSTSYSIRINKNDVITLWNGAPGNASAHVFSIVATKSYNSESYSSTNADTDWQSCGHTPSSFTGFGSVTNIETQCKRQGGDLLIKGNFTSGTTTATEARVSLPIWNGTQLTAKGTSVIPTIQMAGMWTANTTPSANIDYPILIKPSVDYINFGYRVGVSTQALAARNASDVVSAGIVSINARIPIEGWENSNIIIGQFNGLEKCESTLDCTDTFSAKVSAAGVVSDENVDWLDGNATITDTSKFSMVIKSEIFSVTPNCYTSMASDVSAVSQSAVVDLASTTPVQVRVRTLAGGGKSAQPFTIVCQKQGVDYIGKTAKAVASSQNLRAIGQDNVVVYSGMFSNATNSIVACSAGTCASTGTFTGNAVAAYVSAGKYSLTFPSDSFEATTLVSCNFRCNQTSTTYVPLDSTTGSISNASGGYTMDNIGCVTVADLPARTNSSVVWTCTGVKK